MRYIILLPVIRPPYNHHRTHQLKILVVKLTAITKDMIRMMLVQLLVSMLERTKLVYQRTSHITTTTTLHITIP